MNTINFNSNLSFNDSTISILRPLKTYTHQLELKSFNKINDNKTISIPLNSKLISPINLFDSTNSIKNNLILDTQTSVNNINALEQIEGTKWIGKLPSNGNRDVAIIVPSGTDKTKPLEIIYYFHGHNGSIDKALCDPNYGFKNKISKMVKEQNRNIVLVIPQGPKKELNYQWMNNKYNENLETFQNDVLNILRQKLNINPINYKTTIKCHSGGGLPISNAASTNTLKADKIDFLDASYGSWATNIYNSYISKNRNTQFNIYYIPNSPTEPNALKLRGAPNVNLVPLNIGHMDFPRVCIQK